MYSFLKAGSVKICNSLDLQSQGNELIGKGNEAKQLGKNLSKTLHGIQIISESWRLNRTYFGLKNTYFLARHTFYFIRSNFFSFGKLQLKIYSHWLKKIMRGFFSPKYYFHSCEIALWWNITATNVVVLLFHYTNCMRSYAVSSCAAATTCHCSQKTELHYISSERVKSLILIWTLHLAISKQTSKMGFVRCRYLI